MTMRRRDCDKSVALLEKAVTLAGEDSRRGGEFKLWAAQALQGVGRNKQAVEVLKSLKGHRDLDVRKVCVRAWDFVVGCEWRAHLATDALIGYTPRQVWKTAVSE